MAQKKALGRGLGSIISLGIKKGSPAQPAGKASPVLASAKAPAPVRIQSYGLFSEIPVDKIIPSPYQARRDFSEEQIKELADSIASEGLIQPLLVRQTKDGYELVAGERRLRACRKLGMKKVVACVQNASDASSAVKGLIENLQRADLDPIETALGLRRLIEECHLTQDALAHRIGKSRAAVTNSLRLLTLEPELQKALRCGDLSTGHAKVLLSIEDSSLRLAMGEAAIANGWSVRRLEERLRERERESLGHTETLVPDSFVRAVGTVGRFCENRVTVRRHGNNGGTMTIIFRNGEQLEQFLNALESR